MFKIQPVLMCGTILAWAWMIRSLAIQIPIWLHAVSGYLVRMVGG
jgi:hypothetical protein